MEPAFILAIAVLAPTALALRFGADTHPALKSAEQFQASLGISWYGTPELEARAPREPKVVLRRSVAGKHVYPTPRLIDIARDDGAVAFATDSNAQSLQRHARQLADEYWPGRVWLTGLVSPAQLAAVVEPLEAERQRGYDAIRMLVAREPSTANQPAGRA